MPTKPTAACAITAKPLDKVDAEALVVLHTPKGLLGQSSHAALKPHLDAWQRALEKGTSKAEWFCTIDKREHVGAHHLLLDSSTFGAQAPGLERLKLAAARCVATCRKYSLSNIAFACQGPAAAEMATAIYEGAMMGDWSDTRFKGKPSTKAPLRLTMVASPEDEAAVAQAIARAAAVVDGIATARALVNTPNNLLGPAELVAETRRLAREHKLDIEVLNAAALKKQGYNLLLAVGAGHPDPPALVVLRHRPRGKLAVKEHVVIVGKSICFDTGGLCIKPQDSMHRMNTDMGGGAAAIGAMVAAARMDLKVRLTAILPIAVNSVDGLAYTPGSILKSRMGKTVYIENTDAEGRLVLVDAFTRAAEEKADVMVDFATLTGAVVRALGPTVGGLFTDDSALRDALLAAGERSGDSLWHLPLWKEYESALDHPLADINHVGASLGGDGSAIHAANFLKAFVPTGVRWAHVDMAGTVRGRQVPRFHGQGATGYGVRLVLDWLMQAAQTGRV